MLINSGLINLSATTDFPSLCVEYTFISLPFNHFFKDHFLKINCLYLTIFYLVFFLNHLVLFEID